MAKLPENYEENSIEEMLPGDQGYVVPWAMWADENRDLWVNPYYSFNKSPGGTVQMLIERTTTGVIVYINTAKDYKWKPRKSDWDAYSNKLAVELR